MTTSADPPAARRRRAMVRSILSEGAAAAQPLREPAGAALGPALESLPTEEAVSELHRTVLGAPPAASTVADAAERVETGLPLLSLAWELARSDLAARRPDDERARVAQQLRRWGLMSAAAELGIGAHPADGPLYTPGNVAQDVFIHALYEVALRRRPTPDEVRLQAELLARGASRAALTRGFAAHPTARAHFLGTPSPGLRGRLSSWRDRRGYLRAFEAQVRAAENRRIAEVGRLLESRFDGADDRAAGTESP